MPLSQSNKYTPLETLKAYLGYFGPRFQDTEFEVAAPITYIETGV